MPIPWWLFYLAIGLVLEAIQIYIVWSGGVFDAFGIHFFQFYYPVNYVLALYLMHAFDRRARTALERFRPVLRPEAGVEARLRYELTTLPARPTILAGAIGLAFGVLGSLGMGMDLRTYPVFGMNTTQTGYLFLAATFIPTLWVWFTFIYHTIHQLRVVRRIYAQETRVDLYRLRPIYALAELTALAAVGFAVYTYPWLEDLLNAASELNLAAVVLNVPFFAWPIVIFLWPLWGAHRTLVELKEAALTEAATRSKSLSALLHERIDQQKLSAIDEVHKAITALEFETARLLKIPTWPWHPGTFRGLLAAVLLPLVLWIVQFGLQRLLVK
ncbi:MAG TPA: hypothetical protein VI410_06165 [Anaerolineales bacterium]|nr:hypothetical protein [Anaerolineales bacterium]